MKKAFSTTTLFVGSDCTGPYDVTLYGKPTVKDFLNQLLEERREWGYIRIYNKKEKKKSYYISYSHGNVDNYDIPDSIMNAKIVMADGSGGWSRSDFTLTVDVKIKNIDAENVGKGVSKE